MSDTEREQIVSARHRRRLERAALAQDRSFEPLRIRGLDTPDPAHPTREAIEEARTALLAREIPSDDHIELLAGLDRMERELAAEETE